MKKTVFVALTATALLMSSCQTMNQFYGATTGASIGGMFGSAIGGMVDGPRGSDLGTVAGMAIGGIIGAAATAPKTDDGNYRSSDYYCACTRITNLHFSPKYCNRNAAWSMAGSVAY